MENIGWFSDFVTAYGVQAEYGFVTVDLYEKRNIPQVSLLHLTAHLSSYFSYRRSWETFSARHFFKTNNNSLGLLGNGMFVLNRLNTKTFLVFNLAEYPLFFTNSVCGLVD